MISSLTDLLPNPTSRTALSAVWIGCLLLAACASPQPLPATEPPAPQPAVAEPSPAPDTVLAEEEIVEPAPRPRGAPQIEEVYGARQLNPGQAETYRARMRPGATPPVQYVWDFGDGAYSVGSTVTHRFEEAGTYRVSVVARNRVSADTSHVTVRVGQAAARAPAPPPAPVAAGTGMAQLTPRSGEVVWILGRHTADAQRLVDRLRESGFSVGLVPSEEGEPWLGVGPYQPAEAEGVKPRLERFTEAPLWLYSPDRL